MIIGEPCRRCGYLSCLCDGMQLPEVPVDRRAQRARSRSDFYQAYSESQEFNAIVFRNWTANEMGEVRNREASAAIDYEANMLWLRDAAP